MIVERIVAALFNATWQTVAIALLAAFALRTLQRTSASARCAVWTGVLVVGIALPFVDFAGMRSVNAPQPHAAVIVLPAQTTAVRPYSQGGDAAAPPGNEQAPPADAGISIASALQRIAQIAFFGWLAGIAFFAARFVFAMTCLFVAKNGIEPMESRGLVHVRLRRAVRLGLSDRVAVPCLLGFFRPVIALPRSLAAELAADDLKRIVLHESAHLERRDDWFNLLEQVALVVFFFNPAMHYAAQRIGMEREIACDDHVIAVSENRLTYAECLTFLAQRGTNRRAITVPGFFTNRRQILVRIEELLDRSHNGSPRVGRKSLAAIAALAVFGLLLSRIGIPVIAAGMCPKTLASLRTPRAAIVPEIPVRLEIALGVAAPVTARKQEAPSARIHARTRSHAHISTHTYVHAYIRKAVPISRYPNHVLRKARVYERTVTSAAFAASSTSSEAVSQATITSQTISAAAPQREQDSGYLDGMSLAGYSGLGAEQLIELHDHGVSPEMVAEFKTAGYTEIAPSGLIELRDHSVSAPYAQSINELVGRHLDITSLVRLRDHGVTPAYIEHVKRDLNATPIPIDELIRLRDAGL